MNGETVTCLFTHPNRIPYVLINRLIGQDRVKTFIFIVPDCKERETTVPSRGGTAPSLRDERLVWQKREKQRKR